MSFYQQHRGNTLKDKGRAEELRELCEAYHSPLNVSHGSPKAEGRADRNLMKHTKPAEEEILEDCYIRKRISFESDS